MSDIKTQPPKAYQQGWTEFYKLKFKVNPSVLIPRPETELLVDEVLKLAPGIYEEKIKKPPINEFKSGVTIIDIGTGSGSIAITIAKNFKEVGIVAADISEEALEVAQQNAKFHHVDKKVVFIKNDLYEKFTVPPDIIVTNLPYIPSARLLLIDPMVTEHEPRIALDGGEDGFELYRKLFKQIKDSGLFPKYLIAEIDEEQGEIAKQEAKRFFQNSQFEVKKDLARKDRILIIKF